MSDFRKARIVFDAVYKDGTVLKHNHIAPARVNVLPISGAEKYHELNIRIVVDAKESEELLEGLCRGNVSLSIEHMLSPVERESNS